MEKKGQKKEKEPKKQIMPEKQIWNKINLLGFPVFSH